MYPLPTNHETHYLFTFMLHFVAAFSAQIAGLNYNSSCIFVTSWGWDWKRNFIFRNSGDLKMLIHMLMMIITYIMRGGDGNSSVR